MLERLDTLIAFVVVMLGVSLIITIFIQIISTVLGLRGSNLLWGIETLLDKLAPAVPAVDAVAAVDAVPAAPGVPAVAAVPAVGRLADVLAALPAGNPQTVRALAEEILTHPLVSDSMFSGGRKIWLIGPIVGFLCDLPKIGRYIQLIGRPIQRWRFATAIGADELARVLAEKAPALGDAGTVLNALLTAPDPEASRRARLLNAALAPFVPPAAAGAAPAPGYVVQVDKIIQQATDSAHKSAGKLEAWFNSSMDRVSQRFVMQMRLWTIAFAFCLAFAVHLDSLALLDQISTNAAVRTALVGMKNDMLGQAKAIIPQAPAQGAAQAPAQAPAQPPAQGTEAAPVTETLISPDILQEALNKLKESAPKDKVPDTIGDRIVTVKDAEIWLNSKGVPPGTVAQYRSFVVSALVGHADSLMKQLQKAGVDLIPSPYPGDPKQWLPYRVVTNAFWFKDNKNFLGILLTAAFLSLGAPFWYNALKNLSNLRTVVANKQDQQQPAA